MLHLVRFCFISRRLNIDDLFHIVFGKDEVVPTDPVRKSKMPKHRAKIGKKDIFILTTAKDGLYQLLVLAHSAPPQALLFPFQDIV